MTTPLYDLLVTVAHPAVLGAVVTLCERHGNAPTATQVVAELAELPTKLVWEALGCLEADGLLAMGSADGVTWWRPTGRVRAVCLHD